MARKKRATADLTDQYIRCRAVGHAWIDYNPTFMKAPLYGWRLSFICERCETERHDNIDSLGQLGHRSYVYPQEYRDAGIGTKGVPRNSFRVELAIRRYGRARRLRDVG